MCDLLIKSGNSRWLLITQVYSKLTMAREQLNSSSPFLMIMFRPRDNALPGITALCPVYKYGLPWRISGPTSTLPEFYANSTVKPMSGTMSANR
ncbi:hypothetical protein CS542_05990 [Pedobacter sp. IW39]|nr:hypothetical protein CS542_05990 [Pedobacter sp. IW39]